MVVDGVTVEHRADDRAVRAIEATQVIEELIQLAREMREANARGEETRTHGRRTCLHDALETNDSAVQVLGDETPAHHCQGTGPDCAQQRHHRLDPARERARQSPPSGQAYPPPTRLPAGQTGESNPAGA